MRTAIILSLGMLLEKVDTSGFIIKLVTKATQKDANFKFANVKTQAFTLSENFNQKKLKPEEFNSQVLQLLGIEMEDEEFWSDWNKIVTLGEIAKKVQQLQEIGIQHNALFYLSSDTNLVHVDKIAKEIAEQKITLDTTKQPMTLGKFPLYATCQAGKNRQELIKHIVSDIQAQQFNKPDAITLVLGDPENIQDPSHRTNAENECKAIAAWGEKNGVSVKLLKNSVGLEQTLKQIFVPENTVTETPAFAMR